jgi:Ran GTPase-activating protein (RanGAP) involved in mRNA processing and transport
MKNIKYKFKSGKFLKFYESEDGEPVPAEQEDPEAILQDKITQKMDEIGADAAAEFEKVIDKKSDIILSQIQKIGIEDVLYNFITQRFLPSLEDMDSKLFVTVNLDDFILYLSDKFSERIINSLDKNKDKKDKKDDDKKDDDKKDKE